VLKRFNKKIIDALQCPSTKKPLFYNAEHGYFFTKNGKNKFRVVNGIPVLKQDDSKKNKAC
tara:strand:+ start:3680 stop:3862 length:183 start_codon:yes stop_codon:yes gene_type:complete